MRILLAPLLFMIACAQPPVEVVPGAFEFTGEPVVTVNQTVIRQGMVDAVIANIPADRLEMMKAHGQIDGLVDSLAVGELLYMEAIAQGVHKTPEAQQAIAMAAREVLANQLLEKVAKDGLSDAVLQQAYEERKVQFSRPEAQARHILVADRVKAQEIFDLIKAGGNFEELAKANSSDQGSAAKGGDLGWFEQDRMVPEFGNAVFSANKGDLLGPIQSSFGFHVIEVLDRRDARPMEAVRPMLERNRKQKVVEDYLSGLKAKATITKANAPAAPTGVIEELTPPAAPAPAPTEAPAH